MKWKKKIKEDERGQKWNFSSFFLDRIKKMFWIIIAIMSFKVMRAVRSFSHGRNKKSFNIKKKKNKNTCRDAHWQYNKSTFPNQHVVAIHKKRKDPYLFSFTPWRHFTNIHNVYPSFDVREMTKNVPFSIFFCFLNRLFFPPEIK